MERQPCVARQVACPVDAVEIDGSMLEQLVDDGGRHVQLGEAGPAGVDDQLVAVLVGGQADDARLEPQREVLGDDGDVGSSLARLRATARMR